MVSCKNESPNKTPSHERENTWQLSYDTLSHNFITAIEAGNIDGVMECIWNSPNFIFVNEKGEISRGWNKMKVVISGLINATEWRKLTINEISSFRSGDAVYSVGLATWNFKLKDGPEIKFNEVWTDVAKRINGKFVYIVDHAHDLTPFQQNLEHQNNPSGV